MIAENSTSLEALIAAVCRLNPVEAARLAEGVPGPVQAKLVMFCYPRAHLREKALAIAVNCPADDLLSEAGLQVVTSIRHLLSHREEQPRSDSRRLPTITLASRDRALPQSFHDDADDDLADLDDSLDDDVFTVGESAALAPTAPVEAHDLALHDR